MFSLWFSDLKLESGQEITNEIVSFPLEILFKYPCEGSTECSPYIKKKKKGIYLFEVWGAAGGGSLPGYGAFVSGILTIKSQQQFYFYNST